MPRTDNTSIAQAPAPDILLLPAELAQRWRVSVPQLAQWRYLRQGPSYVKLASGSVRYRVADVEAWENEHLVPAGQATRGGAR